MPDNAVVAAREQKVVVRCAGGIAVHRSDDARGAAPNEAFAASGADAVTLGV